MLLLNIVLAVSCVLSVSARDKGCEIENHSYNTGDVVPSDDDCETCVCHADGWVYCDVTTQCPPDRCHDAVKEPGVCCKSCPNGPNCMIGKNPLRHGEVANVYNDDIGCYGEYTCNDFTNFNYKVICGGDAYQYSDYVD